MLKRMKRLSFKTLLSFASLYILALKGLESLYQWGVENFGYPQIMGLAVLVAGLVFFNWTFFWLTDEPVIK